MPEPTTYEAHVPSEPETVVWVIDRARDVWQRNRAEPGEQWTCVRQKVPNLLGLGRMATWETMLVSFGPLVPLTPGDPVLDPH